MILKIPYTKLLCKIIENFIHVISKFVFENYYKPEPFHHANGGPVNKMSWVKDRLQNGFLHQFLRL